MGISLERLGGWAREGIIWRGSRVWKAMPCSIRQRATLYWSGPASNQQTYKALTAFVNASFHRKELAGKVNKKISLLMEQTWRTHPVATRALRLLLSRSHSFSPGCSTWMIFWMKSITVLSRANDEMLPSNWRSPIACIHLSHCAWSTAPAVFGETVKDGMKLHKKLGKSLDSVMAGGASSLSPVRGGGDGECWWYQEKEGGGSSQRWGSTVSVV